jgi:hypothetical protein
MFCGLLRSRAAPGQKFYRTIKDRWFECLPWTAYGRKLESSKRKLVVVFEIPSSLIAPRNGEGGSGLRLMTHINVQLKID